MEHNQALGILIQACQLANTKGCFTLEQSGQIAQAVAIFSQPAPVSQTEEKTLEPETPEVKEKAKPKMKALKA